MAEITNTANIAKNRITRERYIQDCEKVNPGQNHMSLIVDKGPAFLLNASLLRPELQRQKMSLPDPIYIRLEIPYLSQDAYYIPPTHIL